jgi:hypothetical protein
MTTKRLTMIVEGTCEKCPHCVGDTNQTRLLCAATLVGPCFLCWYGEQPHIPRWCPLPDAAPPKSCVWTKQDGTVWHTACGQAWVFGTLTTNVEWCPFCGAVLEVKS